MVMTVLKQLKYSFTLIFHPFDGFWDLKHEKRGSVAAALVIVALLCVQQVFKTQFTGFIYNPYYDGVSLNVFKECAIVIATFFLWCIANWSLTTLMDGEGTFGDIVMASGYAMTPFFLIGFPLIFLSNIMSEDFEAFYYLLFYISRVYLLLFILRQRKKGSAVSQGKNSPSFYLSLKRFICLYRLHFLFILSVQAKILFNMLQLFLLLLLS